MNKDQTQPDLFPDTTPKELADAEKLAADFNAAGFECDAYDVLISRNLSLYAEAAMDDDKALRTSATKRLFGGVLPESQRSLVVLAIFIRRVHSGTYAGESPNLITAALVEAVLGPLAVATKSKRAKHPGG